jgi:hypothetical protein
MKVSDLLKQIEDCQIVLPQFQRGFEWKNEDFKKFLVSIYNNWPTGTILIWNTLNPPKLKGGISPQGAGYTRILLDGQQRMTTLYFIIKGQQPPFYSSKEQSDIYNLYFNVESGDFRYYLPSLMENKKEWISVTKFFVESGNAGLFIEKSTPDASGYYVKNISKLNKLAAINQYNYFVDEEKLPADMPLSDVVKIFNLVNKQGRKLMEEDLALAHITVFWPELKDLFTEEIKLLKQKGFEFDFQFLILCVNSVATGHANFDNIYNTPESRIQDAWTKVKKSLEYLVNILHDRSYISTYSQSYRLELKTDSLLVPVVVYLSQNNFEFRNDADLKKFQYWLYLAMVWMRFTQRGKSSPLEQDVVSVTRENSIDALLKNLKRQVRDFKIKASDIENRPITHPLFNMMLIVAKHNDAIDWFTGNRVHAQLVGQDFQLQRHHIFPKDVFPVEAKKQEEFKKIINEIANRAFLTRKANLTISNKKPESYLKQVKLKYPDALKQQFVPEAEELWKIENYSEFLRRRREIITCEINNFLSDLVSERMELTINDLLQQEESYNLEFKSSFIWDMVQGKKNEERRFDIVKSVLGFLNSNGGILVIGVNDNGNILGLENDYSTLFKKDKDGFLLEFSNFIQSKITITRYKKYISTKFESIQEKDVFTVQVEKSGDPVFIKKGDKKLLFVRIENRTIPLDDPEEIHEYVKTNWPDL